MEAIFLDLNRFSQAMSEIKLWWRSLKILASTRQALVQCSYGKDWDIADFGIPITDAVQGNNCRNFSGERSGK